MTIRFAWINRHTYGVARLSEDLIIINRDLLIAEQVIHEGLHLKHWSWSEARVINVTRKRLQRMTVKQIKQLARWAERRAK